MNSASESLAVTNVIARYSPKTGPRIDVLDCGDGAASAVRHVGQAVILGHRLGLSGQLTRAIDDACRTRSAAVLDSGVGCCSALVALPDGLSGFSDPVGQFPLFLTQADDHIVIGSSAAGVAAETGGNIDPVSLTARIACPDVPDLLAERTMFVDVLRVPEGTILRVDSRGVQKSDYRRIRVDPDIRLTDAAEQLRGCLVESVRARRDTAVQLTADFSGGLDSTSLAFLASTSGTPIIALTSHNEDGHKNDDIACAAQYARFNFAIAHHVVPGSAGQLPFQGLTCSADEPLVAPLFTGPLRARLTVAARLGTDLHLVGEGADTILGAPPAYLADLARRGELATLWRHCVGWGRLRVRSPVRLFRRAVSLATTGRHRALLALARQLDRGHTMDTGSWEEEWIGHWNTPQVGWLTTRARRLLAAHVREFADQTKGTNDAGFGDMGVRGRLRAQTATQQVIRNMGRQFGISVHAPFLDSGVVRACLSVAAYRRTDPAVPKRLLREALAGLVPEPVLSRPTKGDYTREAYLGVRSAAPMLRSLLAESAAADCGLLEPGPVRRVLDRAVCGMPTPWGALSQVFAIELWLRETHGRVAPM